MELTIQYFMLKGTVKKISSKPQFKEQKWNSTISSDKDVEGTVVNQAC